MHDLDFVRAQPVGVRHVRDGIAVAQPNEAALRVRRFLLVAGCQELLYPYWVERTDKDTGEIRKRSEFRVSVCGRQPVGDHVNLYKNGATLGYSGVMRCGNVWTCVICSGKVMRKRCDQISQLFDAVHASGGSAVMVTYTAGHRREDKLVDLLDAFKRAQKSLSADRRYRDIVSIRSGAAVVTEIKFGNENGWHAHQHQAWFFPFGPVPDVEQLASDLFPRWQHHCSKFGLKTIEFFQERRIGVDVRPAWNAAEYMAKFDRERDWSLPAEITAGRLKLGQGESVTPWALLEDAILRGKDSPAAALWLEYCRATKGKACVSLKPADRLLKSFGMPTALDDFIDANEVGDGEIIGVVARDEFDRVVREGGLGRLLEAARKGEVLSGYPGIIFNKRSES